MKHFVEAREDALKALTNPAISALTEKTCLVVDLQGRCRVLAKPLNQVSLEELRTNIHKIVGTAADVFWIDKVWLEEPGLGKADKSLFETAWKEARPEPEGQDRTFVLDRRLSKDAWLGSSVNPPWPLNEHTPPIISFYSFKGGVGRTTALFALAIKLARAGKTPLIIDFDLEAPGAGSGVLPAAGAPPGIGILDFLMDFSVVPPNSLDVAEFYHRCDDRAIIKDGEPIYVLPSGTLDRWYLEKLARVNYEYLYKTAEQSETISPLHALFKLLRTRLNPYAFLIDSRAGLHDLGGLSLSGIAHFQVLFGLGSPQSWDGIKLAVAHLGKDMVSSGRTQRDCAMVHAMVSPIGPVREAQIRAFKENSFQVFCDNYYNSPDNREAEWPVPDPESTDSPHFPAVVSFSERLSGYSSVADVADPLCEGEYSVLAELILAKVGRTL